MYLSVNMWLLVVKNGFWLINPKKLRNKPRLSISNPTNAQVRDDSTPVHNFTYKVRELPQLTKIESLTLP